MRRIIPYIVVLAVLALGIVVFRSMGFRAELKRPDNKQAAAADTLSVRVWQAKTVQRPQTRSYYATLKPCEEGTVGAKIPGNVVQILFKEGDQVSAGTPLIVLDDRDIKNQLKVAESQLNAAKAALPKAEANLEAVRSSYDTAKSLFDQGALPKVNLDNADTALKVARADLESLKANIHSSEAGIASLQDSLANTVIKAPISGIVDEKNVELGQFANPGIPLAKVKNTSVMNAVIKIDQNAANAIKIGQKATVEPNGDSAAICEGIVSYIGMSADPVSRTFDCKVELQNRDRQLRPGVYAKVTISGGDSTEGVLAIPFKALAGTEGSYYVFTVENGAARKHDVTVGETFKDLIGIKSGITDGANVIVTNVNMLQDGDSVSIISSQGE